MKYLYSLLLIFSSCHLLSDNKSYFSDQKFLKCTFATEGNIVFSYHYLFSYPEHNFDENYTFATLKTTGNVIQKKKKKNIPYVFYESGKPKNSKLDVDDEFIFYEGDSDEILHINFSDSDYYEINELQINRYNLKTINYIGQCELINREIFIEELSNFRQLREEILNELQKDFAL